MHHSLKPTTRSQAPRRRRPQLTPLYDPPSSRGWGKAFALGRGHVLKIKNRFSAPSLSTCCLLCLGYAYSTLSPTYPQSFSFDIFATTATISRRPSLLPQVGQDGFSAPPQPHFHPRQYNMDHITLHPISSKRSHPHYFINPKKHTDPMLSFFPTALLRYNSYTIQFTH